MNEIEKNEHMEVDHSQELTVGNKLEIIEDGLRKEYLSRLTEMAVVPKDIIPELQQDIEQDFIDNVRVYRITEMVYEKGELAADKFTTVFNTLSTYSSSLFIVLDSDGEKTDFYIGVRNNERDEKEKRSTVTLGDTLKNSLVGNYPGIKIALESGDGVEDLSRRISKMHNITSVSVIGTPKDEQQETNEQFIQGLEKMMLAMQGRQYTGLIIAENQSPKDIQTLRYRYQKLYTKLSPFQKVQFAEGTVEGVARNKSFTEMDGKHKIALIGNAIAQMGGIAGLAAAGPAGGIVASMIGGQITGFVNALVPQEHIHQDKHSNISTTTENKQVSDLMQLLDDSIKRTDEFDSYGMWNVAGYFVSDDMSAAEIAASNYRSLMNGEKSGRELSAINSWRSTDEIEGGGFDSLAAFLSRFMHPKFYYGQTGDNSVVTDATTYISGKELGLHIGLPRATTPGLPVIEHAEFGKEVYSYNLFSESKELEPQEKMTLGKVFDLGKITDKRVELNNRSLNMHTFITGSTGSGKSNTVYQMLNELHQDQIPFLVVEPAKGEYKDVFGSWDDVNVFSTNPNVADLININPFKFPDSIHVLEHIDGLVEIFSVCWPMYDAMPAFFKDAILRAYEFVGWDLGSSTFEGEEISYPNFEILAEQLDYLISQSDYASDIKSNYRGVLITRVKSLAVGLNKYIFTDEQTPYEILFDQNCILDISRVKSGETKALIMGLVVYILNEYRADRKAENNSGLKHVTVLEEAHNLLKNKAGGESELVGKSVEMLTQTIAEIRTYGEGFIIVDQSPSSVDIAAIKNTNTKIVLRTPEANDREAVGRSMGLTEDQVNEIAKLPSGVAVVYQNDWVSPVLTMINKADVTEQEYLNENPTVIKSARKSRTEIIKAIMQPWIPHEIIEFPELARSLNSLDVRRESRELLSVMICTYRDCNGQMLWDEGSLGLLRNLLFDILNITHNIYEEAKKTENRDSLRRIVQSKTIDFTTKQIDEICHILTAEE